LVGNKLKRLSGETDMYSKFFGMMAEPFGVSPDPRFFFSSEQHAEATASLYYTITQRRGFAALIGHPGLGKTSVLVNLAQRMAGEARIAFLVHPQFGGDAVLESVLLAMGLEPVADPVGRLRQLHKFLLDLQSQGKTCVVIIDEAQNLGPQALETIRMLSNFEAPSQKLIQFILAGQPGLAELLRAPECEQLLQRINVVARLEPLGPKEAGEYVAHRLSIAGARRDLFSPSALKALLEASQGVPRNINTLCFNTLTLAFAEGKKAVDVDCVLRAARERDLNEPGPVASKAAPVKASAAEFKLSTPSVYLPARALLTAALALITLIGAGVLFAR
jgi:general secretion pathway protein A